MYRRNSLMNDMFNISRNLDSMFGDYHPIFAYRALPGRNGDTGKSACSCYPAVDVASRDDRFVIRAEMPGVDPHDIEVTMEEGRLVLRGEKKDEFEENDGVHHREVYHGKFERSFTLPEGVKDDDIAASYRNGVLEIVLPKNGAANPVRIPIDTGRKCTKKN